MVLFHKGHFHISICCALKCPLHPPPSARPQPLLLVPFNAIICILTLLNGMCKRDIEGLQNHWEMAKHSEGEP